MSIYIRGMDMPKAQFQKTATLYHVEGTIFVYPDGKARTELSVDYKERKSYPLTPVPPHGDLIERSALEKRIKAEGVNQAEQLATRFDPVVRAYGDCYAMVQNAPTIIPAEGNNNDR